jgi:dihydrofolate synthase/folylpolyglutamate synthase
MFPADLKHPNADLQKKLSYLYTLGRGVKLDLGFRQQYLDLLSKLGNPHLTLPPTIHVAGTNGKGSTIAFLRAILEASGYKVHAYTSPHLIKFNERIRLAGQLIDDSTLESLVDETVNHINKQQDLSFFEITTAMAFAAFSRTPADILLLETGLGGRLDCTNVIQNPLLTIITPIGLDHQEFLGSTLEQITLEKAGIMKNGTPCIAAHQTETAIRETLKKAADNKNIQLISYDALTRPAMIQNDPISTIDLTYQNNLYQFKSIGLRGIHQIQNAETSIAALNQIAPQFPVTPEAVQAGLQNVHWPARLQNISPHIHHILPKNWECWVDGGHNADAAKVLHTQIELWEETDPKTLHLIIGMMPHKDPERFIEILKPHAQSFHPANIADETKSGKNWQDILRNLAELYPQPDKSHRVLICGSLYLAGNILQTLGLQA